MKNLEDGWDLDFEAENERSEEEELNNMDENNTGKKIFIHSKVAISIIFFNPMSMTSESLSGDDDV